MLTTKIERYIRPYQDGDELEITDTVSGEYACEVPEQVKKHTFSAVFDGRVVAIGGLIIFFQGTAEAWLFCDKSIKQCGFWFVRAIRRQLDRLALEYGLHRVQAVVSKEFKNGLKLVFSVGFQPECELKGYFGVKKNAYLFCKLYNFGGSELVKE